MRRGALRSALVALVPILASALIFSYGASTEALLLLFPPLLLAVAVGGRASAFTATLGVCLVGVLGTRLGSGPFVMESAHESLEHLELFLVLVALTGFSLAIFQEITDYRRTEEALKISDLRHSSLVQASDDAIIGANAIGDIISWNQGAERIFGYKETEILGRPITVLMPERFRKPNLKGMTPVWETIQSVNGPKTVEHFGLHKNGTEFPLEQSLASWKLGDQLFYSAIIRDITDRKRVELEILRLSDELERKVVERTQALEASQKHLELIMDGLPALVAYIDRDLRYQSVNRGHEDWFGLPKAKQIGMTVIELLGPQVAARLEPYFTRALSGRVANFEGRFRHRDGTSRFLNSACVPDVSADGTVLGFIMLVSDLTEQKSHDAEQRKWGEIFKRAKWGMSVATPDDTLIEVNPAFAEMHGATVEEWKGLPLSSLFADESKSLLPEIARKVLATGNVSFESLHVRKDGSKFPALTDLAVIRDDHGKILFHVANVIDLTESRRAEEERTKLIASEGAARSASKMKSEFLATISHEIRTPINGVIGMADLLLETGLTHEQREYADTVRRSADTLLALINDVLDFSKIEAGKLEIERIDFDLEQTVVDVERTLANSAKVKGLKLKREFSALVGPARFQGDPTRVTQVLMNLVNNAIKFTPRGEVSIGVNEEAGPAGLSELRFEVKDTGIGISEDESARIFQPFSQADASTTRKYGGSGLGLSICKHLVQLMGGEIGVRSVPGQGSTFWFTLALARSLSSVTSPGKGSEAGFEPTLARAQTARILLVEDNLVNQTIAIKMLERHGFRVNAVTSGQAGLLALHESKFDLVLMDCQMPQMDGYEATRLIRKSESPGLSRIPIIAMTANAMNGDREKCLEAGMTDYVSKPIRSRDLARAVLRNLGV